MTTAIDTNVIIALWDSDPLLGEAAQTALDQAFRRGNIIISAPVFVELMAAQGRTEAFVRSFVEDTSIVVDWVLDQTIWMAAGRAFQSYAERRRRQRQPGTRRILADFLIGAHASIHGYRLLTFDEHLYRAAFPTLAIESL